ncbi:hypothetical protein [Rhodococcus sp. I2R]|nr:hypothetical protein [Rhodococcus sp. I2R]
MRTTTMGTAGWTVPVQGLGCMRMGEHDRPEGDAEAADASRK